VQDPLSSLGHVTLNLTIDLFTTVNVNSVNHHMARKGRGWQEEEDGFSSWVPSGGTRAGRERYKLQLTQISDSPSSTALRLDSTSEYIDIQPPLDDHSQELYNGSIPLNYRPVPFERMPRKLTVRSTLKSQPTST